MMMMMNRALKMQMQLATIIKIICNILTYMYIYK